MRRARMVAGLALALALGGGVSANEPGSSVSAEPSAKADTAVAGAPSDPAAPLDASVAAGGPDTTAEAAGSLPPDTAPGPDEGVSSRDQTGRSVSATVTVKGVARHKRKDVSASQLRREEFKKVAATAQDPLRTLSTLPGVTTASDLSVRPVVRGGDLTETGVQLDGVPLLMPYHFASVFSVFHREALDDFQLHSGVAPVESEGMLSGTVLATTRPAPMDTLFGGLDISMLRGSAWVGVPVVKDKIGLWVSAQSLWYDWVIKRGMDLAQLLGAASAKDVDEYQSMITLPTTWDLQAGLSWRMDRNWLLDVGGFAAGDVYQVREQIQICTEGGHEVPCKSWDGRCHDPRTGVQIPCGNPVEGTGVDTIANVALSNWLARAKLSWNPDRDLALEGVASFQSVDWDVRFPGVRGLDYDSAAGHWKVVRTSDSSVFDWTRSLANLDLSGRKRWNDVHETRFGIGWGRAGEDVETRLLRPEALLILGTSGNPLEFLGLYPEGEKVFLADRYDFTALDDFAGFRFDYHEDSQRRRLHGWAEHRWDPDSRTRVKAGVRLAEDLDGSLALPNPRLQVQRQLTEADLFGVGFGLHTQSDLPFEWKLSAERPLVSEKAWLGTLEWEHTFAPGWRSTLSAWGKLYQDLASASVRRSGEVDSAELFENLWNWASRNLELPATFPSFSGRDSATLQAWRRALVAVVPDSIVDAYVRVNTPSHLVYASTGEGWGAGLEASLRYQPTPGWTGWASLEWSTSRRKDRPDGPWYPFGLERPWKLSWVNAFRIDAKWEVSVRYLAQAGNPYTPFRYNGDILGGNAAGDTLLWIGKRNSARLSPYQRLDLRISRESRMFGKPATFYYEIWNAFNDPNFVLRDSRTGEFRMVQLNVPFPTVFLGCEVRF